MKTIAWGRFSVGLVALAALIAGAAFHATTPVHAGAAPAGDSRSDNETYRVLSPIESGNLLLFPVVRTSAKPAPGTPFLTLDEGLRNGSVEVTEAGKVRGLVRRRDNLPAILGEHFGDQVNTLVLVNKSSQPLLLLAGEIVTGGKQDRVIAKDRIVPAGGDPIDLSVFCIEPGRWTESSPMFGASSKAPVTGFMVQPTVRQNAMVAKNQQQVWNSVNRTIAAIVAAPALGGGPAILATPPPTTSYAKAMQSEELRQKVDDATAPLTNSREAIIAQLKREGAIGVVVAVRGEIVWADLFANTELLARYWTKLVRSYAAESLTPGETHSPATVADAQRFLQMPSGGTETSEGTVNVYRYSELKSGGTETFLLESLLPDSHYEVHVSKLKLKNIGFMPQPLSFHGVRPMMPVPLTPPVPTEGPQ